MVAGSLPRRPSSIDPAAVAADALTPRRALSPAEFAPCDPPTRRAGGRRGARVPGRRHPPRGYAAVRTGRGRVPPAAALSAPPVATADGWAYPGTPAEGPARPRGQLAHGQASANDARRWDEHPEAPPRATLPGAAVGRRHVGSRAPVAATKAEWHATVPRAGGNQPGDPGLDGRHPLRNEDVRDEKIGELRQGDRARVNAARGGLARSVRYDGHQPPLAPAGCRLQHRDPLVPCHPRRDECCGRPTLAGAWCEFRTHRRVVSSKGDGPPAPRCLRYRPRIARQPSRPAIHLARRRHSGLSVAACSQHRTRRRGAIAIGRRAVKNRARQTRGARRVGCRRARGGRGGEERRIGEGGGADPPTIG